MQVDAILFCCSSHWLQASTRERGGEDVLDVSGEGGHGGAGQEGVGWAGVVTPVM